MIKQFTFVLAFGIGSVFAGNLSPSDQIDKLVGTQLQKQGLAPNAEISDAVFLRRAYLNIGGRIPTIEEAEAFHTSEYPNKRERLIEDLLNSPAYVSNYYHFWADLLRVNGELRGATKSAYELWVKEALQTNKPYDQMVREMVSAEGMIWDNGATGYYFRDRGMPLDNMSNTVRIFLGTRLECAQCHNHPFDKWTQMDYFKMAAFSYGMSTRNYDFPNRDLVTKHYSKASVDAYQDAVQKAGAKEGFPHVRNEQSIDRYLLGRKNRPSWIEQHGYSEQQFRAIVAKGIAALEASKKEQNSLRQTLSQLYNPLQYTSVREDEKDPKLPHDYQYTDADPHAQVSPAVMFGTEIDLDQEDSRIAAYSKWMTSPENPTFTKVIVNRLWKEVFGLGIFEPVDEITDHTEVSNPELLSYLENLMRELDYDIKGLLQILYNTETYQRAANTGEIMLGAPYYFQGPILRRMSAEQIWDSIVALSLPEADQYRPRLKGQLSSIENQRRIYTSLEERPFEEFLAMVQELAPLVKNRYVIEAEYRDKLTEARAAEDTELFNQLRRELREVGREVQEKISQIGYIHLREEVDAGDLLAAIGMNEVAAEMMADMEEGSEDAVVTKLPKISLPNPPEDLERNQKKAWANAQKADYSVYKNLISGMARASELESPARRGHFLRDFGQSDREVIENAADHASVPQALNLLNGPIVQALTNRFAVFGNRVHAAGTPEDKTRMIFQAMLTREPTDSELAMVSEEVGKYGDEAYEGVVWALLNTQQFLFVQ